MQLSVLEQCQGNTAAIINTKDTPFDIQVSSKSIPGYQNSDNLGTFPPLQTITLEPASNIAASVPDPDSILGTLAFGVLGAASLLKRKQNGCVAKTSHTLVGDILDRLVEYNE